MTRLTIESYDVTALGPIDLLAAYVVHIDGTLTPTSYGTQVAERAALAVAQRSTSSVIVHDGPGVAAAALDALSTAAPTRLIVTARRGISAWHRALADAGALILDGPTANLLATLADQTLVVEQPTPDKPGSARVACIPGPILSSMSAGSNALLLDPTVEIVPDLDLWASRLPYRSPRQHDIRPWLQH